MTEDGDDAFGISDPENLEARLIAGRSVTPVRRAVLFASGVNIKLLELVPSEEKKFVVLGSSVLLTSCIALITSTVTASYVMVGEVELTTVTITCGMVVASLIFVLDRMLVMAPLNPYEFPPEVLNALWNPSADSEWFAVLNRALYSRSAIARLQQLRATLLRALLRIAIALAFSFIVAEVATIVIFNEEVNTRALIIHQEVQESVRREIAQRYENDRDAIREQLALLEGSGPAVQTARERLQALEAEKGRVDSDILTIESILDDEEAGRVRRAALSDGSVIETSGVDGQGPALLAREETLQELRQRQGELQTQRDTAQLDLDDASAATEATQAASANQVAELNARLDDLQTREREELGTAAADLSGLQGILIRRQALDDLAKDEVPQTAELEPVGPCTGGGAGEFLCVARRYVVQPTPLGPFVSAFRFIFLAIDLLPILMKVTFSLFRRRPYDALEAAAEERGVATAINLLDAHLERVGSQLERRASERKSARTGTGAEFLLGVELSGRQRKRRRERQRRLRRIMEARKGIRQESDGMDGPDGMDGSSGAS